MSDAESSSMATLQETDGGVEARIPERRQRVAQARRLHMATDNAIQWLCAIKHAGYLSDAQR